MMYMLTINCQSFLLPDNTGIATVLKCLARATCVDDNRLLDGTLKCKEEAKVTVEPMPGWKLVSRKTAHDDRVEVVYPEVIGPDKLPASSADTIRLLKDLTERRRLTDSSTRRRLLTAN